MSTEVAIALIAAGSALVGALGSSLITWLVARGADDRADAREARRSERGAAARQQQLAEDVADAFNERVVEIRGLNPDDPIPFDEGYWDWWHAEHELALRQKVDRLTDDLLRSRLLLVIDSVPSHRVWQLRRVGRQPREIEVANLCKIGRDAAMAAVRGQAPDAATVAALNQLATDVERARRQSEAEDADEPAPA